MTVSAQMVRELREKTNAGMMDCKKALTEVEGDFEKAVDWLRKKGLSAAAKKAGRVAAEGLVHSYIHGEGRIGVLLEVNCETDFVSRNEKFQDFVKDIALHIAATGPMAVSAADLPPEPLAKEREILTEKAKEQGKKQEMIPRIVDGQIKKWIAENCLLEQPFVKNPDKTVEDYLKEMVASIGENIVIRRFVRYELGEGIEKAKVDFASEVAAQINN